MGQKGGILSVYLCIIVVIHVNMFIPKVKICNIEAEINEKEGYISSYECESLPFRNNTPVFKVFSRLYTMNTKEKTNLLTGEGHQ